MVTGTTAGVPQERVTRPHVTAGPSVRARSGVHGPRAGQSAPAGRVGGRGRQATDVPPRTVTGVPSAAWDAGNGDGPGRRCLPGPSPFPVHSPRGRLSSSMALSTALCGSPVLRDSSFGSMVLSTSATLLSSTLAISPT